MTTQLLSRLTWVIVLAPPLVCVAPRPSKAQPAKVAVVPIKAPRGAKYFGHADPRQAVFAPATATFANLLRNPNWRQIEAGVPLGWAKYEDGFAMQANSGHGGQAAVMVQRSAQDEASRGIQQQVKLDQKTPRPLLISGWSRAQNVSGSEDVDYSLYVDVTYQDGTTLWGQSVAFAVGSHDWQRVEYQIAPAKPIKSIVLYALFRGHTGQAWFSDLKVAELKAPPGTALFDALPIRMARPRATIGGQRTYQTKDGLKLRLEPGSGRVSSLQIGGRELSRSGANSGFLARDVANDSGFYAFAKGQSSPLKLKLESNIQSAADHIAIRGRVSDSTGKDRAVSVAFALPIDARGWHWGQDIRQSRTINDQEEYSNTVLFEAGANGRHSLYPLASISDDRSGLCLALDMNYAAQNRIAYNAATRQFFIVYDFGLTPEKPSAEFRFVLYRSDARWKFRGALDKLYRIFPDDFALREGNRQQGLWMPFSEIKPIENWQDFGFRFREAGNDPSVKWDDAHDILTFRYSEPMTWWMPMPPAVPRTYDQALAQLQSIAADPRHEKHQFAQAVLSSGFRDEQGHYPLIFRDVPWANGAVWSLNVSPLLAGSPTGGKVLWNPQLRDTLYRNNPNGELDGEYLDSIEGYVTAALDFDRDHFHSVQTPLTFSTGSKTPAQHKALSVYEFTRAQSRDVHRMGKLMFANGVPSRFSFLTPWLDVMGTETDWMLGGSYRPDDDASMNLRRSMSGPKPYLLLQNTDFDRFTSSYVQKYFERSLFYGIFPGFFSADAANKPYWQNPNWYNRDRALFQKYMPIIRVVAEAGWQPITLAVSNNANIHLERFGQSGKTQYLTLRNNSDQIQSATITLQKGLKTSDTGSDLMSGQKLTAQSGILRVSLQADQTMALRLSNP